MSGCTDCKDNTPRVEAEAIIRFDTNGSANAGLLGKNLKLVNAHLMTQEGAMPKGGFRIEMVTNGDKHRISIYRMCLPFDELMAILQFDENVGVVQVSKYALTDPFVQLSLTLTKEYIEPKLYQQIAPLVYRVPNRAAFIQLLEKHKLTGMALERTNAKLVNNAQRENWPMLVVFHEKGEGSVTMRNAPVIDIPNWKNNADWQ
ncbi:hypothetical protein D3C85_256340 [compost metagenome]